MMDSFRDVEHRFVSSHSGSWADEVRASHRSFSREPIARCENLLLSSRDTIEPRPVRSITLNVPNVFNTDDAPPLRAQNDNGSSGGGIGSLIGRVVGVIGMTGVIGIMYPWTKVLLAATLATGSAYAGVAFILFAGLTIFVGYESLKMILFGRL